MHKTLKYRLYRSKQNKHLVRQIESAASVWNHSVALSRRYYRLYGKHLSVNRLMKHIAKLRRRNPYWQRLGSQAVQDVCQRLDRSYQRFFKDKKAGKPSFKKRTLYRSFTLKQAGWKYLGNGRIRIGARTHRFVESRAIEGTIKTVTIKRDRCGDLWLCFSVEVPDVEPMEVGRNSRAMGFDFGLKDFLTDNEGKRYKAPEPFKASLNRMAQLSSDFSRKEKGSNHHKASRLRVAKLHRRLADQRRDWHFKLAHTLCDEADVICLEDLCLSGMKTLWGRKVSDLGFAQFVSILEWVALKRGKRVVKIDRFYASTKTCSNCGYKQDLSLSDRSWSCDNCGSLHDRDQNAALNICREGASSLGLGDVRPFGAIAA